jgi:hypothetical protein
MWGAVHSRGADAAMCHAPRMHCNQASLVGNIIKTPLSTCTCAGKRIIHNARASDIARAHDGYVHGHLPAHKHEQRVPHA